MNNNEINLDDFINKIFNNKPQEIKSICLSFFKDDYENNDNINDLFNNLCYIFTEGVKILFSNNNEEIKIENITDYEINLINKYFNSFGIIVNININNLLTIDSIKEFDINNLPKLSKNYLPILNNNNDLSTYYFSIKKLNKEYIVSFDFI